MTLFRKALGVTAAALSLALATGSAHAASITLLDDRYDAMFVSDYGIEYGEYDIDLVKVRVDHRTTDVVVTSTFTELVRDSWNGLSIKFDTNGDRQADFQYLWSRGESASVFDARTEAKQCAATGAEKLGLQGSLTATVSRACLGSPKSVSVHVDAIWFGYNEDGDEMGFVDSAPGALVDEPLQFSQAVAADQQVTIPAPEKPRETAKATKLTVKLSSKTYRAGDKRIKVTAVPKATTGKPAGRLRVTDNGRLVKSVKVKAGKKAVVKLPKKMKKGTHRIKVTFTPTDRAKWRPVSRTVKLKVK